MDELTIRTAKLTDAKELLDIYAPYTANTAITFEYETPSLPEFEKRMRHVMEKYPYLVAEIGGEIAGYAYADAFRERAAYGWAVETTIYVRQEKKRTGVGRKLYEALEKALALQNILNLNACIGYPEEDDEYLNKNSVQFHEHLGYRLVGEFYRCGYKFNRWYNMVWMEKIIGRHTEKPLPVRPFDEIRKELAEKYGIE